jgi:hypothetical protein
MNVLLHDAETTIAVEGGGWLSGRRRDPTLDEATAAELLRRGEALPASLRHVRDGLRTVVRLGELPLADSTMDEALGGLLLLLEGGDTIQDEVTVEELETALDSTGVSASRRQAGWSVSPPPRCPRELLMTIVPGGVRVRAALADWDEIDPVSSSALAEFLASAQAGLRFARCTLDERNAHVMAFARASHLESDLLPALRAVATGCELLAREASALLRPELAEHYLAFRRSSAGSVA